MRTAIAAFCLLTATAVAAEDRVRHPFQSSVARGRVQRVVLAIPAGDVTIRNGAPDRLAVSGEVSRDPDGPRSRAKEQQIINDITVEIYVSGDEAIIRRRFGPEAKSWRAEMFTAVDILVEVPRGMALEVETRAGDVTIDGSFGDVNVDLRAGEVNVRVPKADVRELRASCRIGEVRTNIGGEVISREGFFPGQTRYVNASGKSIINVHTTLGEVRVDLTR
jgi:hypothetical protein